MESDGGGVDGNRFGGELRVNLLTLIGGLTGGIKTGIKGLHKTFCFH